MSSVAAVANKCTVIVQMVAFSDPSSQLPRYLETMEEAGLQEMFLPALKGKADGRLWRSVPSRRWYSDQRGETPGSQEVPKAMLYWNTLMFELVKIAAGKLNRAAPVHPGQLRRGRGPEGKGLSLHPRSGPVGAGPGRQSGVARKRAPAQAAAHQHARRHGVGGQRQGSVSGPNGSDELSGCPTAARRCANERPASAAPGCSCSLRVEFGARATRPQTPSHFR
jgi:hypothetical protein